MRCFNFTIELAALGSKNLIVRVREKIERGVSLGKKRYHLGPGSKIFWTLFYVGAFC